MRKSSIYPAAAVRIAAISAVLHTANLPAQPGRTQPDLLDSEPVKLFSDPDYGSIEYQGTMDKAAARAAMRPNSESVRVLERNEAAFEELVRQLDADPLTLDVAFDVGVPEVRSCTISSSSIRYVSPKFTPGTPAPDKYRVETDCDERGLEATILVDRALQGLVSVTIRSSRFGGVSIYAIDDSGYAAAFQDRPLIPSSSGN